MQRKAADRPPYHSRWRHQWKILPQSKLRRPIEFGNLDSFDRLHRPVQLRQVQWCQWVHWGRLHFQMKNLKRKARTSWQISPSRLLSLSLLWRYWCFLSYWRWDYHLKDHRCTNLPWGKYRSRGNWGSSMGCTSSPKIRCPCTQTWTGWRTRLP